MSFGMIVTRFAWIAHRLVSSNRCTCTHHPIFILRTCTLNTVAVHREVQPYTSSSFDFDILQQTGAR
jgi:hypothetical protein